jgi:hypothetical protein
MDEASWPPAIVVANIFSPLFSADMDAPAVYLHFLFHGNEKSSAPDIHSGS